jgi:exodeoxyribonuclease-3
MRFVVWNCNAALAKKFAALQSLRPDVAVISEASAPERMPPLDQRSVRSAWIGRSRVRGLGVYTFGEWTIEAACAIDPRLEWVLPLRIRGPLTFNLLAIWAMHGRALRMYPTEPSRYQVRHALDHYVPLLRGGPLVVAGDFNNNVTWDRPGGPSNHRETVEQFAQLGLVSAYHVAREEDFGAEREPTMYWRDRTEHGPRYHIDFCFMPREWLTAGATVEVGAFATWIPHSDHVPLVISVNDGVVAGEGRRRTSARPTRSARRA